MSYEDQDNDLNQQDEGGVQTADNNVSGGSSPAKSDNQTAGSENSGSERLPFHKDPEVQRYLERQISKERRQYEEKFKSLEERLNQRPQSNSTETGLSPEEVQALETLFEKAQRHPKAKEWFGTQKLQTIEERLNSSSSEAMTQVFETELGNVVENYATKYGYDKAELEDELREFMAEDPWLRGKEYQRGSMQKVAKLYFADKGKELAERETNLKLINEKKTKQQNGTEVPAKGSGGSKSVPGLKGKAFLEDLVKRNGGEIAF